MFNALDKIYMNMSRLSDAVLLFAGLGQLCSARTLCVPDECVMPSA